MIWVVSISIHQRHHHHVIVDLRFDVGTLKFDANSNKEVDIDIIDFRPICEHRRRRTLIEGKNPLLTFFVFDLRFIVCRSDPDSD